MRKKKIFTPMIAVGLAVSLSNIYAEVTTSTLGVTLDGNAKKNFGGGIYNVTSVTLSGENNTISLGGNANIYDESNNARDNATSEVHILNSLQGESLTFLLCGGSNTGKGGSGDYGNASLILEAGGNTIKSIANGARYYNWNNGSVFLKQGKTTVLETIQNSNHTTLKISLESNAELVANIANAGGNLTLSLSQTSTINGNIQTSAYSELDSYTQITIKDGANATIQGSITEYVQGGGDSYNTNISLGTSSLTLNGNEINKITTLSVANGGNAILKGKVAEISNTALGSDSSANLTFSNTQSMIATLTDNGTSSTLSLDATANAVNVGISNALSTSNLTINFNGIEESKKATLTLNSGGNFKALTLSQNSAFNTLILGGNTTTITNLLNVSANQGITFEIGDSASLDFQGGLTTSDSGTTTFDLGNSTLTTATTTINGTITNTATNIFNINARNTTLQYGTSGLSFSSGTNEINFANPSSATLDWQNSSATTQAISTSGTSATTINFKNNGIISGGVSTLGGKTNIEIWNANATLYNIPSENYALKTTGGNASIDFKEASGSFSGNLLASGGSNTITFAKDGTFGFSSTLSTDSASTNTFTIDKNITIRNNLSVEGVGSNNVGTIPQQAYGTFFNIANNSSLTLSNNGAKTSITTNGNGATTLAFQGSSGSFSGKLIANFSSKSGKNLISFAQGGTFGFDAILDAQQGYNRMEISQDITITTDIYATGASDESIDRSNSFIIDNGKSLALSSNDSKKTIYTQGGETVLSFQKTGSFSGNLNTSNGLLELDFKDGFSPSGDYTIDLDTEFYAGANGENRIRFYDSTRNLILRSDGGFSFRGEGNGNNSIFIGSSNSKISFTDKSSTTQTLTYNGGENTITFANTGQTLEANILNTQGNLTFVFGSNEKGITIGQATINGNITADGGNNAFSFLYDSSTPNNSQIPNAPALSDPTLSMGASSQIIANSTSTNTFAIDKNITFLTDLTLSGDATGNGGNIFNISSGKNLVLQDSSSAIKTLYTTGGQSKITFEGSGNLVANLSTSGGTTTFSFTQDSGTYGISGLLSTSGEGQNIIDLSNKSATIGNDLRFSGSDISGNGGNFINIGANQNLTLNSGNINTASGVTNLNFNGTNSELNANISTSGGTTTFSIDDKVIGIIGGAITLQGTNGSNNVVFKGSNGGLILKDNATLTFLSSQGSNNAISLHHNDRGENNFKTLTIGTKGDTSKTTGISGNGLSFLVYAVNNTPEASPEAQPNARDIQNNAPKVYADKIVIHSSSNEGASTHHLGVVFEEGTTLNDITYERGGDNNILVASVANESGVSFNKTEKTILGFTTANVTYTTEDVVDNGVAYKNYYVKGADNLQVAEAEQAVTATAFMLNYDLYMANLNSLNKRMGELRENAHSQGVWARVFNGAQSNNFGLGSKNNYTTIQAGYDYAFGSEGANNYLGVALSYALSTSTTSSKAVDSMGEIRSIDSIYSNAVEVALYNSYVSDSGWYNDSIAKFSYLMSSFDIANSSSNATTNNNTTNFALTLGDEVGYVFKLGEAKEWSITPQVEFTMGYFNQSDFKQTLANSSAYLDSIAESVLTLRTRAGSAFAYDFKNFTQKDTFNASLYVGAFYEYDYVNGGNITMSTDQGVINNELSDIGSDGRVVMNVGTNMSIKDNTRLYFDFEKSFAGKITTDYQVNFGVRYSFGESNGYAPMAEKAEFKAPLKIEGKEGKEEQESKEKTEDKAQKDNQTKEDKKEQVEAKEDSNPQE